MTFKLGFSLAVPQSFFKDGFVSLIVKLAPGNESIFTDSKAPNRVLHKYTKWLVLIHHVAKAFYNTVHSSVLIVCLFANMPNKKHYIYEKNNLVGLD